MRSVLEGADCADCKGVSIASFTSVSFLKGIRTGVCTPLRLREVKLLEEFDRGMAICHTSATHSSELLDTDMTSLESSDLADSALLASRQEEQDVALESELLFIKLIMQTLRGMREHG